MKINRIILLCTLYSVLYTPLSAQNSMFSIGVRGGGQTFLSSATAPSGSMKGDVGFGGTIDLRYAFYGCFTDRLGMGFTLGAGIGYGTAGMRGDHTDNYSNTDYLGKQIDYTVTSSFRQQNRFATAEASLMLAFCFGNVIMNVGPRFMMPFAAKSELTITNASIDAYYPEYYVHVVDKMITGYLQTPYTQAVTPALPECSVLMGAEIGYEWYFDEKNCLGIQLYADVGVWNKMSVVSYQPSALIEVAPITDATNPAPNVTVNASGLPASNPRYLDFGLRVYYAFSVNSNGLRKRSPSRDTRLHHNRYRW